MAQDPRGPSDVDGRATGSPQPEGIDVEAIAEDLEADGTHQGIHHRADGAPADREHGRKTRARAKDIINGRR